MSGMTMSVKSSWIDGLRIEDLQRLGPVRRFGAMV